MGMDIAVLGVDLGKNVCSVVGLDASGAVVMRRKVRRETLIALAEKLAPCVVGTEACCGAHHLGRVFAAHGHDVRLMSPEYVRPYVKAQKNDDPDAEGVALSADGAIRSRSGDEITNATLAPGARENANSNAALRSAESERRFLTVRRGPFSISLTTSPSSNSAMVTKSRRMEGMQRRPLRLPRGEWRKDAPRSYHPPRTQSHRLPGLLAPIHFQSGEGPGLAKVDLQPRLLR